MLPCYGVRHLCRETQAVSNKVTQKVAKDRDLVIGLFFFLIKINQIPNEIEDKSLIINEDIAEIISSIV